MSLKAQFHYPSSSQLTLQKDEWKRPTLTWGEKVFLAELRSISAHFPNRKIPYKSVKMAEHFNVSPMTVNKWIKSLATQGYLKLQLEAEEHWNQYLEVSAPI